MSWLITVIFLLTTTALAQPIVEHELQRRQFPGYVITSLEFWNFNNTDYIQFSINDDAPADNATRICSYKMTSTNGTVISSGGADNSNTAGYVPCSSATNPRDFSFEWMAHTGSVNGFDIQVKHSYSDKSLGPCSQNPDGTPIYCGVTTWAQGTITAEEITCNVIKMGYSGSDRRKPCRKMKRCSVDDDVHLTVYQAIA